MKDRLRKRRRSLVIPAKYRRKGGLDALCTATNGDMKPLTFADLEAARDAMFNLRVEMHSIQHPGAWLLLDELLREPAPEPRVFIRYRIGDRF